jgi:hypothetical protein
MPSGACTIRRDGVRGAVWYLKYRDAAGVQVKERLGGEADGWNERKAERELRHRLADVERKGWRRPAPLMFATYAQTWFAEGEVRRRWKRSTVAQYRSTRERLVEHFGPMPLGAIRPRHVAEYVAEASSRLGPSTVSRDVSLLHAIFVTARPRGARRGERRRASRAAEAPETEVANPRARRSRQGRAGVHRPAGARRLLDARLDRPAPFRVTSAPLARR